MPLSILALLTVRNESDYISHCLRHLIDQGLSVCLIDNGSTDDTVQKASEFLSTGKLRIEHLAYNGCFELANVLKNETRLTKLIHADWYMHHDADEIRYAPAGMGTLQEAIEIVDKEGFNAINFDEFVFLPPTLSDRPPVCEVNYEDYFTDYYYFSPRPHHRLNAWKNTNKPVDLISEAGHQVKFEGLTIYPKSFTLKHYIGLSKQKIITKYASRVYSIDEMLNRRWHGARAHFNQTEVVWPAPTMLKTISSPGDLLDKTSPLTTHPFLNSEESREIERADELYKIKYDSQKPLQRAKEKLAQVGILSLKVNPAPFVVGVMRSGTTLLRLMLDAHPELAVPSETRFFPALNPLVNKKTATPYDVVSILESINTWPDFELEAEDLLQNMTARGINTPGAALRMFYQSYAQRFNKLRWGDKTPYYNLHMDQISLLIPEARFIHIIRDGRDVALSTKGLWFDLGKNIEEIAVNWMNRIRQTRQLAQLVPHYIELRYEDLISAPEQTLRKICKFIHLPFSPLMLEYHHTAKDRLDEFKTRYSTNGEILVSKERRMSAFALASTPPQKSRIERWRNELTTEQILKFEAIAGPLLGELGYDLLSKNKA